MTVDEQLREMARHADLHQRVITAAEVVQRASGQDRPPLAAHARLDEASAADPGHRDGDITMLETEDRPTRPESTTARRSPSRWILVAAAAVVVAVVGTLVVAGSDDDDKQIDTVTPTPTTAAPAQDPLRGPVGPGRWFVDPDGDDATPLRVTYQVPEGWGNWFGAYKYLEGNADGFTGLSITTVSNLVSDGCRDHTALDPPVGPTVDDLATALSQLAPFEVTAPPTDVTLLGYQGKHLELTVPALTVTGGAEASASKNTAQFTDCVGGELYSWISPINDYRSNTLLGHSPIGSTPGAFNAYQTPGQTEEFWILDVEGTRVVLVTFDTPLAPAEDVAERDAIFDSIRIEP